MPYYIRDEEGKGEDASTARLEVLHSPSTRDCFTIFGIPVVVSKDGDVFTVSDSEINMYGLGDTREEAEEDYKNTVLEYFDILNVNEHKLSENLKGHLYYLRSKAKYFEAVP